MAETKPAENTTGKGQVEQAWTARSLLFVPGSEERKLERARDAGDDALILDLEDSVSPGRKTDARRLVAEVLRAKRFGPVDVAVRINPPGTPYFEDDLDAVLGAGGGFVMVSKCESAEQVGAVARKARGARLLLLVETPLGIVAAPTLAGASPSVEALCFGPADFSMAMGLAETDASRGIIYHARCSVVLAAKARGVAAVDSVFLSVKDDAAFRKDAELGIALGYDAKLCIHPRQVEIVNAVYTPGAEDVNRARRVVEAFERAAAEGRGVTALDGMMIDAPLVAAQRRLLARSRRA